MPLKPARTFTALASTLALTVGVAACGNDSDTSDSGAGATTAPAATTAPVASKISAAVEKKAKAMRSKMEDGQRRLEQVSEDIQSGKIKPKEGQERVEKITKEIESETQDFQREAADTAAREAAKSGDKVTKLDLDGSSDK